MPEHAVPRPLLAGFGVYNGMAAAYKLGNEAQVAAGTWPAEP